MDMFEEARAMEGTMELCHITQKELAERMGVSQSYVANKLRLLRLSPEARAVIGTAGLTERHARAVLRLPEEGRLAALRHIAEAGLNVAGTEKYVEQLLGRRRPRARSAGVIKDIRLFYNSLDRAMALVREAGIGIAAERREDEEAIEVVIRIQKPQGGRKKRQVG